VPLQAREQLVVDVKVRVRDRVGVLERYLLCVTEERAEDLWGCECGGSDADLYDVLSEIAWWTAQH
jgi:hypothetical protein